MRTRRTLAIAMLGAAAAGCGSQLPLEGGASTLVVSSVLNAMQDTQVVVVQQARNGGPGPTPVDGATVTITGPDGVGMTGIEMPDTALGRSYRVALSAFHEQLVPGGTYQLHVTLISGEDVTGTTTIPIAQPVSSPGPTGLFNETTDTLRLAWPPVQGAASYEVRAQSSAGVYALFVDTSVALPGTLRSLDGKSAFVPPLISQVTASAVDANYYRYYRTNGDPFTGAVVQGNLTGAQGVFGSIVVVAWRTLRVTPGH